MAKCSFGNEIGAEVRLPDEELFAYNYGSILVTTDYKLNYRNAQYLGKTTAGEIIVNGTCLNAKTLRNACCGKFATIYADAVKAKHEHIAPADVKEATPASVAIYPGEAVEHPLVYIPVFPGTNCDYDSAKAFRTAGAEVKTTIFRNLTGEDVLESIDEMAEWIDKCHILMFAGGFSAGDEPDGSGKFIATMFRNPRIKEAISDLLENRDA